MKKIILLFPLLAMMACKDSKKTPVNDKQAILDSITSANYANEVRQRTIDSMNTIHTNSPILVEDNTIAVTPPKKKTGSNQPDPPKTTNGGHTANTNTSVNTGTTASPNTPADNSTTSAGKKKKGMSNKTKGAVIGAAAGVVTGVITGAATSKDKTKGAVIGGVIGGAIGSGVGYGIGDQKDKKNEKAKKDTVK